MWRKYDVTLTFMTLMSCDSICCMRGKAWNSRWFMTQLTNGQQACMLVFMPMVDILNISYIVTVNLFSLYLMNFMFHTTVDAVGNILSVHYKSMKCDVSFSQGSISTLFRWGADVGLIANLKGPYFQPSLSVCVSVCLCDSDRHFYPST